MKKKLKVKIVVKSKTYKGVRGRRIKIEPQEVDTMLVSDKPNLIQKGKVLDAGPEATVKKGDIIIFNAWGCDKIELGEEVFYYILDTDEFILEIL